MHLRQVHLDANIVRQVHQGKYGRIARVDGYVGLSIIHLGRSTQEGKGLLYLSYVASIDKVDLEHGLGLLGHVVVDKGAHLVSRRYGRVCPVSLQEEDESNGLARHCFV